MVPGCFCSTSQVNGELAQPPPAPASQLQTFPYNGKKRHWCKHTLVNKKEQQQQAFTFNVRRPWIVDVLANCCLFTHPTVNH